MSTTPTPDPTTGPTPQRRLTRRRDDRMIAGVCGGVADYLGLDPTLVRLLAVVAAIVSVGTVAVAYIAAWILMPEV